jgi:hypothetical protein
MDELAALDERLQRIVLRWQFEPVRDAAEFKRALEAELWAEVRSAIERGDVKLGPEELRIEVKMETPQGPPFVEVGLRVAQKKRDDEADR